MSAQAEKAALVALLRSGRRTWREYAALAEEAGELSALLEQELGLLAEEPLQQAAADLKRWSEQGLHAITVLDAEYPDNLRAVHDRPALIFVAGRLTDSDSRSVAVIGSRRASPAGPGRAPSAAQPPVASGSTIASRSAP